MLRIFNLANSSNACWLARNRRGVLFGKCRVGRGYGGKMLAAVMFAFFTNIKVRYWPVIAHDASPYFAPSALAVFCRAVLHMYNA